MGQSRLPREAGLRRLLRVNLGLLLLGALVALAWVLATSASTSAEVLAAFRPAYALPLLGISALCVWLRFVRWQFLLRRVDVRVPTRESLSLYLASLVGIATPAHVGEVLRCVFLRRRRGVPLPRSLEVLVAERVLDVLALAVLGSAARPGEAGPFAVALAVMGLLVVSQSVWRAQRGIRCRCFARWPVPLTRRVRSDFRSRPGGPRLRWWRWPSPASAGRWP